MILRRDLFRVLSAGILASALVSTSGHAQFIQQGPKLVATGAVGLAEQGSSVSIDGDGNTLIVGGPGDNNSIGAAWIYTRSHGAWKPQTKLVGMDAVGAASEGTAVALSADGKTAILGGPDNSNTTGAVWIFVRSNGLWTQQAKLLGAGAIGAARQGIAVALSFDGDTALIGGWADDNFAGAAWVFTRWHGTWSQQAKLIAEGIIATEAGFGYSVSLSNDGNTALVGSAVGNSAWIFDRSHNDWKQKVTLVGAAQSEFGASVALSGDGGTAIVGAPDEDNSIGAAWVYTKTHQGWKEQAKLVGEPIDYYIGPTESRGGSVALSNNGNVAIVGAPSNLHFGPGTAWIFTRKGSLWSQDGSELRGSGGNTGPNYGNSTALSGDGDTVVLGVPGDNFLAGATWVFTRLPVYAGTPGSGRCYSRSISGLTGQYGGLSAAASAIGFARINELQDSILTFCEG